jgi:acetyltransferase-like isoleucine patch superfamily enzyme
MNERPLVEELGDASASPYRRYLRMFVGQEQLGALLRYELLTGCLGPLPGALGYFLRARCYRWLLASIGRGTVLGRSVVLRSPNRIRIGAQVMIDDHVVLDAKGETSSIVLGDRILLGRHSILSCNEATISMGDLVSIGPFCFFASKSRISIGSGVSIGSGAHLLAGGHADDDPNVSVLLQARLSKGIVVENNVWIGTGSKILDGVSIGHDSIVGAGSVVTKDVPPWSLVLGNPARMVQKRKRAESE